MCSVSNSVLWISGGEKGDTSVSVANGAMHPGVGYRLNQLGLRAARCQLKLASIC